MRAAARLAIAGTAAVLGVAMLAGPASAKGGVVGGAGSQFFLNDSFTGSANTVFNYGKATDAVYVGDWDGNGTDTLMLRRGNTFYVRNTNSSGPADTVFAYGRATDTVLVGDWDGNGTDTLAVRRGNAYYIKNSVSSGPADKVLAYGRASDTVLVGDWDGNGTDTLAARRGSMYYIKNSLAGGNADHMLSYGRATDTILVGHWSGGQAGDSLGVRRGNVYYLRYSLTSGPADKVLSYGRATDAAFAGDWDGDRVTTLGIRRPPAPPVSYGGSRTYRVGADIPAGIYRSSGGPSCYWARLSGFGGTLDDVIANDLPVGAAIVEVKSTDAGFYTDECGNWQPVEQTYPASPWTSFGDGTYVVGSHIAPGTYHAPGGPSCYWERESGFGGVISDDIIANDNPTGAPVVTISPSDAGFSTHGCGTWTQ